MVERYCRQSSHLVTPRLNPPYGIRTSRRRPLLQLTQYIQNSDGRAPLRALQQQLPLRPTSHRDSLISTTISRRQRSGRQTLERLSQMSPRCPWPLRPSQTCWKPATTTTTKRTVPRIRKKLNWKRRRNRRMWTERRQRTCCGILSSGSMRGSIVLSGALLRA